MAIHLDPSTANPAGDAPVTPANTPAPRVTAPTRPPTPSISEEANAQSQKTATPAGTLQANVTFRRDDKGQIYYVLTDAQSGKEIREVPPAEIRKVGEGIEDFLKQEESKASSKLDSKA